MYLEKVLALPVATIPAAAAGFPVVAPEGRTMLRVLDQRRHSCPDGR